MGVMHPCHAAPENIKAMSAAPGGRSPTPAHNPSPGHSRISISLPAHPSAAPTRRRVGPDVSRVHLSVTTVVRVGLHLWRAGEITRPHHDHPPHREKIFFSPLLAPRHFSLLPSASPASRREICAKTPPAARGEPRIRARPVEVMLLVFSRIFSVRVRCI